MNQGSALLPGTDDVRPLPARHLQAARRASMLRRVDGIHDLGGMEGFGPVRREPNEPVFHDPWEGRVFAMVLAVLGQGKFTTDEFRYAIERMAPARYLSSTYYERWADALARIAVEKGLLRREELDGRLRKKGGRAPRTRNEALAAGLRAALGQGAPTSREAAAPPRFAAGERVRVKTMHPRGHTRCPRYVRGATGIVESCRGVFVLADASARGDTGQAEPLYTVGFSAADLWAESAETRERLYVDLWESYLEHP